MAHVGFVLKVACLPLLGDDLSSNTSKRGFIGFIYCFSLAPVPAAL